MLQHLIKLLMLLSIKLRMSYLIHKIRLFSNVLFLVSLIVFPLFFAGKVYNSLSQESKTDDTKLTDEQMRNEACDNIFQSRTGIVFSTVTAEIGAKALMALFLSLMWSYKKILKIGVI